MKKRLVSVVILYALVLFFVTGAFVFMESKEENGVGTGEYIVAINEIEQLAKAGNYEVISEKCVRLSDEMRAEEERLRGGFLREQRGYVVMLGICMLFMVVVFGYVYVAILRPFVKMQDFAEKIAGGNFDVPLKYERSNYFGAFTWAFDSMRREITKARSCEKEAIENNKTVIATLSHDIKTPIASIRTYAEGLEANMDTTPEKRRRYLSVIMNKCDEVSRLTNDLFLHSLSDLDKMRITTEQIELVSFVENALLELTGDTGDIRFLHSNIPVIISADRNRLLQVIENLINNARKYAQSEIEVSVNLVENEVEVHFRDYGSGICDEDMPFIFDKFYRGKNCGTKQGSGLGLYIVKYIVEQMKGSVWLKNHADGLEAVISFPICSEMS